MDKSLTKYTTLLKGQMPKVYRHKKATKTSAGHSASLIAPPCTPFLNEYASSGNNRLQASLTVKDCRMVNYHARLQMLVEHVGSDIVMRSGEYAAIASMMLTGNVTEVLNRFDLDKYFLAQNNVFKVIDQRQMHSYLT